MHMQSLVYVAGDKGVDLQSRPVPCIQNPDDVLVKVKASGVCGTDLHVIDGDFPAPLGVILGHETAGVVQKLGTEPGHLKIGDRVAILPVKACGSCNFCKTGRPNLCKKGGIANAIGLGPNGALAEYICVSKDILFKIPDDLSFKKAVLCEPMSTVIHGIDQMEPFDKDSRILVFGGGITGTLAASYLTDEGFENITVCQRSEARREFVRKQCQGFDVDVKSPEDIQNDFELHAGDDKQGFDVIFDSTGNAEVVQKSLDYLRAGGKVVIFGCAPATAEITIRPFEMFARELSMVGSYLHSNFDRAVERVASLNRKQRLNFDALGIRMFDLESYREAFSELRSKTILKAVFVMDS